MSLVDAFTKEDRTEVKFSQFFALVKQAAQYETLMNAVNCDVPHRFIRETMTGKKEEVPEIPEKKEAVLGVVKVDFDAEEFRKILQEATAEIEAKFGPAEDEAEQEQEATEQEQEAAEQEQENTEKEPPEVTAESILEALLQHKGPAIISGYSSPLYEERLKDWYREERINYAQNAQQRREVIWCNQKTEKTAQQLTLF